MNTLGYAAALSLVLATCTILWPSSDSGIKWLSAKVKQLKVALYAGTLLLVGSVLLLRSLFQWSLTFISQPDQSSWKAIEGFNTSVTSAEGGFYTLILAAAFLPAFYILKKRAQARPGLPQEKKEREQILKAHDLMFSLPETSKRILTISAPLLGGLIADLFSRVSAGA